jgi:5'-nucleotidase
MSQYRILVSNDDGYRSEGLAALVEALEDLAEVWVVAPESEQSATSHAITIRHPLRLKEVEGRPRWYAVDGTPTDCAWLGINHVLREHRPELLVSGINHGPNLADDVFYSGTVAAAREAAIIGVPSIAISLAARGHFQFGPAARFARALVEGALAEPLPPNRHLNVNVPPVAKLEEWVPAQQGKHYWIGGNEYQHEDIPGSDCNAVLREGRVAVTALTLDTTDYQMREQLGGWNLKGFRRHDP